MFCYNYSMGKLAATDTKRVRSIVTDVETAQPEYDVFGDVCGVVRDALHVPGGQHVLNMGGNQ